MEVLTRRARARVRGGDVKTGIQEAQQIADRRRSSAAIQYDCAAIFALAAGAGGDERSRLATRAIEFLQSAIAAGNKDFEKLRKDKDFEPIRSEEKFLRLIESR